MIFYIHVSVSWMIEQASLSRAFLQGMVSRVKIFWKAWRAELFYKAWWVEPRFFGRHGEPSFFERLGKPSFSPKNLSQSLAKLSIGSDTNTTKLPILIVHMGNPYINSKLFSMFFTNHLRAYFYYFAKKPSYAYV